MQAQVLLTPIQYVSRKPLNLYNFAVLEKRNYFTYGKQAVLITLDLKEYRHPVQQSTYLHDLA